MEGLERYVIFFFQAILLSYQCVSPHYTSNFFHLPGSTVRVTAKEWPLYWESCHYSLMLLVQWDWTIVACLGALQTFVMHNSQNFYFSVYHHPQAKQTSYYEYQHNGTDLSICSKLCNHWTLSDCTVWQNTGPLVIAAVYQQKLKQPNIMPPQNLNQQYTAHVYFCQHMNFRLIVTAVTDITHVDQLLWKWSSI